MANTSVALLLRVRLADGKRKYLPTTTARGKRLPAGHARAGGHAERFPEGIYYLVYRVAGKQVFENVGRAWEAAIVAQANRAAALRAGTIRPPEPSDPAPNRLGSLEGEIDAYLAGLTSKSAKTRTAYTQQLRAFQQLCPNMSTADIKRQDLLDFRNRLLARGLAARTVHNAMVNVQTFLRSHDMAVLKKGDLPKFEGRQVQTFTGQEIQRLLSICSARERLIFTVFLNLGLRDQEMAHLCWSDVDWANGLIWVTPKPQWDWKPKNRKARSIMAPDSVLSALSQWRPAGAKPDALVFPNDKGAPELHFLRLLKARRCVSMKLRHLGREFRELFPPF